MKILKSLTRKTACVTGALVFLWIGVGGAKGADLHVGREGYIDTHNHAPHTPTCVYDNAYREEIKTVADIVKEFGIRKTLFMPPPHGLQNLPSCNYEHLAEIAKRHRDRFAFLLGGESLNPMIQKVVTNPESLEQVQPKFAARALQILRTGAVGFGEMAAEHFSLHEGHPYMSVPPDHPLFRLLADIAPDHDVPIDLHMEAIPCVVVKDGVCGMTRPAGLNPPNPLFLPENITAFRGLLSHNPNARIIWVHAGWDNTGYRTVDLMRQLLQDHPNLYIQLRPLTRARAPEVGRANSLLFKNDLGEVKIRAGWLKLMSDYPDRFIVGLDSFYSKFKPDLPDDFFVPLLELGADFAELLYQELPGDVADKVAFENAIRIYRLDRIMVCHGQGTPGQQTLRVDANALQGHVAHGDALGPCG